MMIKRFLLLTLAAALAVLPSFAAGAELLESLDMDSTAIAPAPKDECFLSDNEYRDDSIHVLLDEGEFEGVHYMSARIRITHPSQLRTIPAQQAVRPDAIFNGAYAGVARGGMMAQAANAVIAINGDYISIPDICQIAMRQGRQVRNIGNGSFDALVIDRNGDFSILPHCGRHEYAAYYEANAASMYQVFCFGPTLVQDGASLIPENYENRNIIADKLTQRVALAQIGPLEYAIITCDGDAMFNTFGLTVYDFARLCEQIGNEMNPGGFRLAYNLDGGNSATLVFKRRNEAGELVYQKLNMPERERDLADMVCFVSLVK